MACIKVAFSEKIIFYFFKVLIFSIMILSIYDFTN